jgi:4,5-DOPA dioxygenase extradiol
MTMPTLFIGHGSPMNALASNAYTKTLNRLGRTLPKPRAILVISAHWMTQGTFVTAMEKPRTIHDFGGFPKALFDMQYPSAGSPEVAGLVRQLAPTVQEDQAWGLDHGTWSVLVHMYPQADIPVLQLSLDMEKSLEGHFALGSQLAPLREQGVLILGSGNLVHNLRQIQWEEKAPAFPWAVEFDEWLKQKLLARDFNSVLYDFHSSAAGKLSVPTLEHYLPLHYILGAAKENEPLTFEYEEIQNGSISMRTLRS